MHAQRFIVVLWMTLASAGCSSGTAFDDSAGVEKKPTSVLDMTGPFSNDSEARAKIFHATYRFSVKMKRLGTMLCEGTSELVGYDDFSTEMLGEIDCKGGRKLNLSEMMSGKTVEPTPEEAKALAHYGRLSRVKQRGNTTYSPPLPFTIGPIIQNIDDYQNFQFLSEETVVEHKTASGETQFGEGLVSVNVISAGEAFQPEGYPETFRHVLHWERTVEGFDGVDRGEAFLYDKFEYWWNIRPIAIPQMRIEGPLGNFMPKMSGIGNLFGVTLIVEMVLIDHRQL